MNFVLIKHSELTKAQAYKIAEVKSQHWLYPVESQIEWMQKSYKPCDVHILLMDDDVLVGYMCLAKLDIIADGNACEALGVSCVCVDRDHLKKGYSIMVMNRALEIAKESKMIICLLCKDNLVKLYEKCDYTVLNPTTVIVEGTEYKFNLMLCNSVVAANYELLRNAKNISIDRNF